MGVLFRASLGFAIALYALHPAATRQWLNRTVLADVRPHCAVGPDICDHAALKRAEIMIAGVDAPRVGR